MLKLFAVSKIGFTKKDKHKCYRDIQDINSGNVKGLLTLFRSMIYLDKVKPRKRRN